jgi:hypothetical protein
LFGIVAREAPVVVVFRRGPSKWCQLVRWDTVTDKVERGQWFKGRVYERRSDLSPDGKYLVYFGMDARWDADNKGSWTAVSKPPYWTALALWPKGDCWNGGGLFIDSENLWLNCGDSPGRVQPLAGRAPRGIHVLERHPYMPLPSNECYGVYFPRLARDGWTMGRFEQVDARTTRVRWTKARDGVELVKYAIGTASDSADGKGTYYDTYELISRGGRQQELKDVEWADWDHRGRLIFARQGKLLRGTVRAAQLVEQQIADLNGGIPDKQPTPQYARTW